MIKPFVGRSPSKGNPMAGKHFAPFVPDAANSLRCSQGSAPAETRRVRRPLRPKCLLPSPRGWKKTIDDLFADADDEEHEFQRTFAAINGKLLNAGDAGVCRAWWVYRMLTTRVPLREKLTLFWHGHFATSVNKIEDTQLMLQQIDMLRRLGSGSFRELVVAVAKDPAMIVWLDGESNVKEHPNENFARELMELFTCGNRQLHRAGRSGSGPRLHRMAQGGIDFRL